MAETNGLKRNRMDLSLTSLPPKNNAAVCASQVQPRLWKEKREGGKVCKFPRTIKEQQHITGSATVL